MFVIDASKNVQ